MLALSEIVRTARENHGYSQVRLAAISAVSLPTIQNVEAGKGNPSLEIIDKLTSALGLKIRIDKEPPNWPLLAMCGVPVHKDVKVEISPTLNMLVSQLKLACAQELNGRETSAVQATLWAIASGYPSIYNSYFKQVPCIHRLYPHKISGPLIKLRRIALEILGTYL